MVVHSNSSVPAASVRMLALAAYQAERELVTKGKHEQLVAAAEHVLHHKVDPSTIGIAAADSRYGQELDIAFTVDGLTFRAPDRCTLEIGRTCHACNGAFWSGPLTTLSGLGRWLTETEGLARCDACLREQGR